MHQLALDAKDQPAKDVVQRLRPLLQVSGKRKAYRRALPAVELENGELAALQRKQRTDGCDISQPLKVVWCALRLPCCRSIGDGTLFARGIGPKSRTEKYSPGLSLRACHKACGPDGLPGELLKYGHGNLSKAVFQLVLKLAVRREEPLVCKGGIQYHVWKSKKSPASVRIIGILVSSVIAKAMHDLIRRRCVPAFKAAASTMQVGGFPRHPVSYAAHAIRLFQSLHCTSNYFLMFLDLRDAFYRVVRPFLSMEVCSDEAVAATFRALKLPPKAFHAFQENVGRESAITRAGGSPWLQGTIDEVLAGTWFKLPGQSTVVSTSRGTRPGDNLADILFSFVFADVLAAIREVLEAEAQQHGVPWKPEMRGNVGLVDPSRPERFLSLHEATWMDDLCAVAAHLGPFLMP